MTLHESLLDLAAQAPRATSPAELRGVLAESHELTRNALTHGEDPVEISHWQAGLITAALHSPAIAELHPGTTIIPIALLGRGEYIPGVRVSWLSVGTDATDEAAAMLTDAGVNALATKPHDAEAWAEEISSTHDHTLVRGALDTAGFPRQAALSRSGVEEALRLDVTAARPPALPRTPGLPDRSATVDATEDVLRPVVEIARLAGMLAASSAPDTASRLHAAEEAGVLTHGEVTDLIDAWRTGQLISVNRWHDDLNDSRVTLEDLPAVQRSAYGAARRNVAAAIDALLSRTSPLD